MYCKRILFYLQLPDICGQGAFAGCGHSVSNVHRHAPNRRMVVAGQQAQLIQRCAGCITVLGVLQLRIVPAGSYCGVSVQQSVQNGGKLEGLFDCAECSQGTIMQKM